MTELDRLRLKRERKEAEAHRMDFASVNLLWIALFCAVALPSPIGPVGFLLSLALLVGTIYYGRGMRDEASEIKQKIIQEQKEVLEDV